MYDSYVTECFEHYLKVNFDTSKFDIDNLKLYFEKKKYSLTGAEIQGICIYMLKLSIKKQYEDLKNNIKNDKEHYLNEDLISEILEIIEKKFEEVDNVKHNVSDLQSKKSKGIKF